MSKEREILKSLLLKEELQLLDTIKQKVLSEEQFTKEVSKVLSEAIKRAQKDGKDFERALFAPIQKGVSRAFSENKQSIIDGLLPIMGQLIRKTVANSIKQFVADINRTLELGFSTKALKWRWQAFKTGRSFAEIVFQKTVRYQVGEIFLINQENGLLIEHVGTDDMLKDNNAISAMLSVIQEFIGDSLQNPDGRLESAEMGDNVLLFSHGPKAFLVFVVKGSPTERFKAKSHKLIEDVHAEFSGALSQEQNYRNNPDLQQYLRSYLITKNISESQKKINWIPWIVGFLALTIGLIYWSNQRNNVYKNISNTANSIDGLFVQSIKRKDGKFNISGLLDPLADTSQLQRGDVILSTKPFISLDSDIVKKRAELAVAGFDTVNVKIDKKIITVDGLISPENHTKLVSKLVNIAGIEQVNNNLVIDHPETITSFTEQYFKSDNNVEFSVNENKIRLIGTLSYKENHKFSKEITALFANVQIDNRSLFIPDSNQALIDYINKAEINIPLLEQADPKQDMFLSEVIKNLQILIQRKGALGVEIIGTSDCYGKLSNDFSINRADKIKKILLTNSINASVLKTKIQACKQHNLPLNEEQRNVSFKIEPQGSNK